MTTFGLIAPILSAIILAGLLGWLLRGRNPTTGAPLGLPEGSVRAIIGITIIAGTLMLVAFRQTVPPELWAAFSLVLGLYYGHRNGATTGRAGSGSTAGFARLPVLAGVATLGAILMLGAGCTTGQVKAARPVVDKAANKVGLGSVIRDFRAAEGQLYVDENGYISTSNMTATVTIYAVDEGRWITGRVQAVETFTRYNAPIGPAPVALPASPVPPPPAAQPTTQPGAGPSELPRLQGATTGGVAL